MNPILREQEKPNGPKFVHEEQLHQHKESPVQNVQAYFPVPLIGEESKVNPSKWWRLWLKRGLSFLNRVLEARLVQHVGPGLRPLERHEFENIHSRNGRGPTKWIF